MKTKKLLLTSCFLTMFVTSTSYAGFMCDWFGLFCDSAASEAVAPEQAIQAPVLPPATMQKDDTDASKPASADDSNAGDKGLLEEAADALDKATDEVKQDVDAAADAATDDASSADKAADMPVE